MVSNHIHLVYYPSFDTKTVVHNIFAVKLDGVEK